MQLIQQEYKIPLLIICILLGATEILQKVYNTSNNPYLHYDSEPHNHWP